MPLVRLVLVAERKAFKPPGHVRIGVARPSVIAKALSVEDYATRLVDADDPVQ